MPATLSEVERAVPGAVRRGGEAVIRDATHDSRRVSRGALFCAVPGLRVDGHDHAGEALRAGARALLVERWLDLDAPQVRVPSVRAALGPAAATVHGHPSDDLVVVGTTGTNGKTTVSYLLEAAFAAAGRGVGLIGTVETRIHGAAQPGRRTTPEATDLQRLLRSMHDRGVDAVAMEVSSHGLDLHRVDGTRFQVAVFTNLSPEHLDWHGTMDAYLAAKAALFTPRLSEVGVVVLTDAWSRRFVAQAGIPVTTVGRDHDADVRLTEEATGPRGGRARLRGFERRQQLELDLVLTTTLPGGFNLLNAAAALVAAVAAGLPPDDARAGIAASAGAPGRLEAVDEGQAFTVLVDYAHTAAALSTVLAAVREGLEADRAVIVVVGCGGDRDRSKRAPMGAAAAAADRVVLTSDNPRSEDPRAILEEVRAGAEAAVSAGAPARVTVEPDRAAAIAQALTAAAPGDVVLVAGKGHETTQEVAGELVPFDDRAVVRALLRGAPVSTAPGAPGARP